ncbi:hypothetical protein AcV7_004139 [Taiwanofungus camphoratus]|nr:hypothetical protein AcV7_004139 [Antrodia cinnamomea]
MTVDAVDHLNTTRIHRLLRPLRSKCTALSTAYSVPSQHKPSVSTTYSKLSRRPYRRPHNDAVPLPLTVLQYPENLRTNSEWHLSQKIKEIQDTFRNLVRVAQYSIPPNECGRSTRSLAAMCAVIVGDNIHSDIQVYQEFEGGAVDVNGDISTEISDQIYELVPPHYRGYTLVSHALALIMDTCPHHPVLLTALLEICLQSLMVPESHRLLRMLFREALQPTFTSTSACPLTHPAHVNYLVNLRAMCNRHGVSDCTFTKIFIDVMTENPTGRVNAWQSRAVTTFAREISISDHRAFMCFCEGLAQSIADLETLRLKTRGKRKQTEQCVYEFALRGDLAKWINIILQPGYGSSASMEVWFAPSTEDYQAMIDFLVHIARLELHVPYLPPTSKEHSLTDAIVCLTNFCWSHAHAQTWLSPSDNDILCDIMRDAPMNSKTYDLLAALAFVVPLGPGKIFTRTEAVLLKLLNVIQNGRLPLIDGFASALRSRRFFFHEASLWSCTLQYLERCSEGSPPPWFICDWWPEPEIDALRKTLVKGTERAEARCFRTNPGTGPYAISGPNGQPFDPAEWEWEDMIQCWVRKLPENEYERRPSKKRRLSSSSSTLVADGDRRLTRLRSESRKSSAALSGTLVRGRNEAAERPPRSHAGARRGLARSKSAPDGILDKCRRRRSSLDSDDDESDQENVPLETEREYTVTTVRSRRVTNFASILADAQMNCTVLHPRSETSRSPRTPRGPSPDWEEEARPPTSLCRIEQSDDDVSDTPGYSVYSGNEPSSDDALNLFSYPAPSSPIVARPRQARRL